MSGLIANPLVTVKPGSLLVPGIRVEVLQEGVEALLVSML
jgi:hypothetical protein